MSQDHAHTIETSRRLLSEIEADYQQVDGDLKRLLTEGRDHFAGQVAGALSKVSDANVDSWMAQAKGIFGIK